MTARTNGDVRFGTFLCFFGGVLVSGGFDTVSDNMWGGVGIIFLGALMDVTGIHRVESGIKEILRVNDLENKRR